MKTRTSSEPLNTNTRARPYDGSSIAGFGSALPTARAPHCSQPTVDDSTSLKPQHGQIVTEFSPQTNAGMIAKLVWEFSSAYEPTAFPVAFLHPCSFRLVNRNFLFLRSVLSVRR